MTKSHPLSDFSLKFRGYKSFADRFCELGTPSPINVVIGRNNSGKSAVIGAIEVIATKGKSFQKSRHGNSRPLQIVVGEVVTEPIVARRFDRGVSGGAIQGNHYAFGMQFVGKTLYRDFDASWTPRLYKDFEEGFPHITCEEAPFSYLSAGLGAKFRDFRTVTIPTERKVVPEMRDPSANLHPDGRGVTNRVRAQLYQDNFDRTIISRDVLNDLNKIYRGDAEFSEIFCQENEGGTWEIFLKNTNAVEVRLSESGSSLQSVFILLCLLHMLEQNAAPWAGTVLCFEEPENNMHPSLLRRLLEHLAEVRDQLGFTLFITTHSPICIDWASKRDETKIIHVFANEDGTHATIAPTNKSRRMILDDLDIRASDILQSNGIIWVEGPSDRIYLRKWIDLYTDGELKEDVHYSVMFYGGKLLSHLDATGEESETRELISLIRMNRNLALVMDSDRHPGTSDKKPRMQINGTKKRLKDECEQSNAIVWITDGREIENYLSDRLLANLSGITDVKIGKYEKVPEHASLSAHKGDKLRIAQLIAQNSEKSDLDVLDLQENLERLCNRIRLWNASFVQ